MTETRRYPLRRPGLVCEMRGAMHVVVTDCDEIVCEVNETGAALFDLCDGETSPTEMVDAICTMFAVNRDIVNDDVHRTLDAFVAACAIEWS